MDEHPPGFHFYPTEEELVSFYLHNKLEGIREEEFHKVIPVVDIYQFDPWQLPYISGDLCYGDPEQWFFFAPRQDREARGGRPNRITNSGYWKATGSPAFMHLLHHVLYFEILLVISISYFSMDTVCAGYMLILELYGHLIVVHQDLQLPRHAVGNVHASTSQQSFIITADKASSSDIASPENHAHPSQTHDADDLEMPDTILQWEQLN